MSLAEMLALREDMDKTLKELQRQEREAALKQVRQLIQEHNFLSFELFARPEAQKAKVADKYYDPDSGQSWSGRGKPPRWIQGKDRNQYLIHREAASEPAPDPQAAKESGLLGAMANAGVIKP